MAVGDTVYLITNVIMDWLYFAITILIIVKIVQTIWDIKGGKPKWWPGGKEEGPGDTSEDKEYEKAARKAEKEGTKPPGKLDFDNPGRYQIRTVSINNNPIPDVKVVIRPANMRKPKTKWGKRRKGYIMKRGRTNQHGLFPPEPELIPSGWYWVYADERKFWSLKFWGTQTPFGIGQRDKAFVKKGYFYIPPSEGPDDVTVINIPLATKDEIVKGFEPYIDDVSVEDNTMKISGVIK